ncbi:hypothetical protein BGZ72_008235 [Mortierella alpina]|nr:hypothetical protein BGZ72_008235 [Mortierella alpina]
MMGNKHRNNSVSSNASHSSSSSQQQANKHPCKFPTCGWSFKRFEHLKRHMLVHTKERPFVCDFHGCDKTFSRSDNFSAHLRTHTKKSMHMRRFDRQFAMIEPIRTNFGNGHGAGSALSTGDVPVSAAAAGDRDYGHSHHGGDYAPHRHSIAGYPSFSESRSTLQAPGYPSHGVPATDSPTSDSLGNIVPKFNTIKLDLKGVPTSTGSSFEGPDPRNAQYSCTDERYGYPQHHRYSASEIDPAVKTMNQSPALSSQPLHYEPQDRSRENGVRGSSDGHLFHPSSITGHESANPNPDGESPTLAHRGPVTVGSADSDYRGATADFPASIASHFMPGHSNPQEEAHDGAGEDEDEDEDDDNDDEGHGNKDYKFGHSSTNDHHSSYQRLNRSASPPRTMDFKNYSDAGHDSGAMNEDGRSRHHRSSSGSQGGTTGYSGDYQHHRHSTGAAGYPSSVHMHNHSSAEDASLYRRWVILVRKDITTQLHRRRRWARSSHITMHRTRLR